MKQNEPNLLWNTMETQCDILIWTEAKWIKIIMKYQKTAFQNKPAKKTKFIMQY